jgi:hypothetical protein
VHLPYQYYYTDDLGLYTRYSGELTNEIALECLTKKVADPRFAQIKYTINDFTDVCKFSLTKGCMHQISEINIEASKTNSTIIAIAINPTVLSHGMTRMWMGYTPDEETGWTTISVSNWDEAKDCVKTLLDIDIQP